MRKKTFAPEQILGKLRRIDVLVGQVYLAEVERTGGHVEQTFLPVAREYGPHRGHQLRRLCLYRKKINLSKSLAGQAIGVKEVDSGIWLVSVMDYDLGCVDLEERTLQLLENPFDQKCYLCVRSGQ